MYRAHRVRLAAGRSTKAVSLPELWHTDVVEWHEQAPFRNTLGRKLFDAAPSTQKRLFSIDHGGHNDPEPPEYEEALAEFLKSLPPEGA